MLVNRRSLRLVLCTQEPTLALLRQRATLEESFAVAIDVLTPAAAERCFATWTSPKLPTWLVCHDDVVSEVAVGSLSDYELRRFVSDALDRFSSGPLLRARA